jgi:DNA mismatch repair protein MutL
VRFADPQGIHGLVRSTVGEALASRRWLAPPVQGAGGAPGAPPIAVRPPASQTDWMLAREGVPPAPASGADRGAPVSAPLRFGDLRLLGQLLGTYLLIEAKDGLLLVDQHAAHERVLYEQLRSEWRGSGVARQGLLATESIELDAPGAAALFAATDLAAELGFELEPFGERTVVLRAVPALLAGRDPAPLLRGLAEELQFARDAGAAVRPGTHLLDRADALFASLACHSARRAGDVLDPREQQALLRRLDTVPWAPTCPHGRPVAIRVDLPEIERRFGRR